MTLRQAIVGALKHDWHGFSGFGNKPYAKTKEQSEHMLKIIEDMPLLINTLLEDAIKDRLFWQALGRFKKWEISAFTYTVPEKKITAVHQTGLLTYIRKEHAVTRKNRGASMKWRTEAKRCFSMLMEGKTPKDYFKTI